MHLGKLPLSNYTTHHQTGHMNPPRFDLTTDRGQQGFRDWCRIALRESYATWEYDSPAALRLEEYFEPEIHEGVIHNSADPNSEPIASVNDEARGIFRDVNREEAGQHCTSLEQLIEVAMKQATAYQIRGVYEADLKTNKGRRVKASVLVEADFDATFVEHVGFGPTPDLLITDAYDHVEDGDLDLLLSALQLGASELLEPGDTYEAQDYEELDPPHDIAPIWIDEGEIERIKDVLRKEISNDD